jgi:hypothetical protein
MSSYVDRFENLEQIKECAKYYIKLLGLQDWRIVFAHTDDFNPEWAGQCESIYAEKCAFISIKKTIPDNLWLKQPQELTLIHELLHCKFPIQDEENLNNNMYYTLWHQILDDMARAIFNARYNLTNDDYYLS